MNRIHVTGASGSGTTTLAKELADRFSCPYFDTDDYFWLPTWPPYETQRDVGDRLQLLRDHLSRYPKWIISGSLCGWGDPLIPFFDLVVFLWVPADLRMERLRRREREEFGAETIAPGGELHEMYAGFMEWAAEYDTAGLEMRSRKLHDHWLSELSCPVLRLEGEMMTEELVTRVLEFIEPS